MWQILVAAVVVAGLALIVVNLQSDSVGWAGAMLLGVVEGVTEYLPLSSTGHLVLTSLVLWPDVGASERAVLDSYVIVIQAGAIVAVFGLYWRRFADIAGGLVRTGFGRRLGVGLVLAFLPAAAAGLVLGSLIKERLFGLTPVAWAWIVGGLTILMAERRSWADGNELEVMSLRQAAMIGMVQVTALWPGSSRSLVTILGGRLAGLSTRAAVEFSFLLGAVTLTAASGYETFGNLAAISSTIGVGPALAGFSAAAVSAAMSVRWLVSYLSRRSLAVFGWYRIAIGILVLLVLA